VTAPNEEIDPMSVTPTPSPTADRLQPVGFDLLRDIHKGIRAALFAVTAEAGRVDPSDDLSVTALESEVRDVARLLAEHGAHEDDHFGIPVHLPDLAEQVEHDHAALEARMNWLVELAGEARLATPSDRRFAVHELYLELASFTGAYLAHQDLEERVVAPTLVQRIGVDAVLGIHGSIMASMSPEQFTRGFAAIMPAINVDDRCEMLGGMRAGMPAEAFAAVWSLAASVLATEDAAAVAHRLGL
jgi:hypothetical protein